MYPVPGADDFDPGRWEMSVDPAAPPTSTKEQPRPRRSGRFLKGPVPWPWLALAMALPGKALAVGVMLWKEAGCEGKRTVHFCLARATAIGIPTTTARRAVRALERAGLVGVRRKPGRGLDVTILDGPAAKAENAPP
jgi:hypothetical protein